MIVVADASVSIKWFIPDFEAEEDAEKPLIYLKKSVLLKLNSSDRRIGYRKWLPSSPESVRKLLDKPSTISRQWKLE